MIARRRMAALATCALLVLSGCGTRADDAEIQAGAGGGPVPLPQSALDELAAATGATPGAAAPAGVVDTGPAAPVPGGVAPGAATGTTPDTTATTPTKTGKTTTATAAGTGATTSATGPACSAPGAPLNVGQVGTFSGVTGPAWAGGRTAIAIWAKDVNARGGIACHPVTVHFADDGGDPARASAIVQDQVKTKGVVAFVGGHDDLSIAGFKQAVEATKTPAVGGDLIAVEWFQSPYMFPQGAALEDQIFGFIKQSVDAGKTKLGLLYCVEVAACSVANKAVNEGGLAKDAGATVVYSSPISLTQTDFTAQCQSAKAAGVEQFALGMDGSSMARVARSCAAVGFKPALSGIGGTISPGQAADPNLREFTLGTATGTGPWTVFDTPGLKAYKAAMDTYAPGEETSGSSVQLWAAGKLFEAGIAKLGTAARDKPITADMVVSGLRQLKKETLGGLTGPLTFSSGNAVSNRCVFFELLTAKGWTAPRGSKPYCR